MEVERQTMLNPFVKFTTLQLAAIGVASVAALVALYALWSSFITKRAKLLCGHYVHFLERVPLLGNALLLNDLHTSSDVWNFVTDCSNKFPKGVMFWLFHIPWIIIKELDVVEAVLMSSESTEKSHVYRLLDTMTDGVFIAGGLRWKKLRKKLNPTFSVKQLEMLYDDVNDQVPVCIDILKKNTDKYINIISYMTPFFFDVVSRTHFGVATEEQTNRDFWTTEVAANVIQLTVEERVFRFQNHIPLIFNMTRVNQYIKHLTAYPLYFIRKIVSQRLEEAAIEKAKGVTDERRRVYYVDGVKEALEELNIEPSVFNIERNTGDMLIAASDTTSVTVSAVCYYLALNPDIQEKVYEEVLPIFGDNSTKEFTKEDLNRMEYLEMVIKETLRHTAPPGIVRELTKDLDVGKYIIPKGTNVYLVMKAIHKSPEYYERAEDFYPEHFLPETVRDRPKFAFLPFSHGPRNCPGTVYSYITMKSVISSIVRNFKLETNIPLKDIQYKMVLMQEHKNGYYIKLTSRM